MLRPNPLRHVSYALAIVIRDLLGKQATEVSKANAERFVEALRRKAEEQKEAANG